MKDIIINAVEAHNGIKAVELVLKVMDVIGPSKFDTDEYHNTVDSLIRAGDIFEFEYCEKNFISRIKSIYFSRGTTFIGFSNAHTNKTELVRQGKRD